MPSRLGDLGRVRAVGRIDVAADGKTVLEAGSTTVFIASFTVMPAAAAAPANERLIARASNAGRIYGTLFGEWAKPGSGSVRKNALDIQFGREA